MCKYSPYTGIFQVSSCSEAIGELQVEEPSESTDPGGSGDGEETKKPAKKSKAAKRRVREGM